MKSLKMASWKLWKCSQRTPCAGSKSGLTKRTEEGGKQKHPCKSPYNGGAEIDSFYLWGGLFHLAEQLARFLAVWVELIPGRAQNFKLLLWSYTMHTKAAFFHYSVLYVIIKWICICNILNAVLTYYQVFDKVLNYVFQPVEEVYCVHPYQLPWKCSLPGVSFWAVQYYDRPQRGRQH